MSKLSNEELETIHSNIHGDVAPTLQAIIQELEAILEGESNGL